MDLLEFKKKSEDKFKRVEEVELKIDQFQELL